MFYYRVTKYNPKYRNEEGHYLRDEWTDFSCVGVSIAGHILSLEEYEEVEGKYIKSILLFLGCVGSYKLKCTLLEKHTSPQEVPQEFRELYNKMHKNFVVEKEDIPKLLKMLMRCYVWCVLVSEQIMIRFGYDFYLYIRISQSCENAVKEIESLGLFVEDFKNPWINY